MVTILTSIRSTHRRFWPAALMGLLLALLLATVAGPLSAQGNEAKPIRLVTGDYVPEVVKPVQVQVSADAVFDGKYFKLIQFAAIPGDKQRQAWAAAGLTLADYLPDDTYFAIINVNFNLAHLPEQVLTVVDVPNVVRLETPLTALRARGQPADQLVVSYYATLDVAEVIAALQARGAVIQAHRDYSRQLDIAIDPARLEEIIALPFLQFLGLPPEPPVLEGYDHRNSTGRSNYLNTGYNGLNYNGAGVVVGIGEGGTVDNLLDVKGRLTEMVVGSPSDHKIGVMQNSGGAGNLDPANRNNAWGATFLSIESYPNYATLYGTHNLRYTNHSFGSAGPTGGYDQTARDHDLRIAAYPIHLVIYSSGNSGASTGYAPYNFATWATITGAFKHNKNMFSCGALEPDDDLGGFSSRGPLIDGRIAPQLVIEGIEGTSDAAPKLTGLVAMLDQVYKAKNGGAEPPSSLLRAILMNTADDLDDPGPDYKTGYGRPNMRRAYNTIDSARYLTGSVSNGGTNSHTIAVPANTRQVRILIVWPDVAAAVNANPAIVNDLNLLAWDPPHTTSYNPWVLDETPNVVNIDLPATRGVDNLNTIEQVTVDDPAAGNWTVEVSGFNVPSGPQTYYLTYEFLGDELHMGFPLRDHRFESGTLYRLKWDSYGGSGTFNLDYQLDGGSWTSIASALGAATRSYDWTAPSVTGIHTIRFRVQRGSLTAESDVNYIGPVPQNLAVHWACADAVRLVWDAVAGATSYRVYRLGTHLMEEVAAGITFDGTSAILSGQSTTEDEYYAVSALTGTYEGQRTIALRKAAGDYACFNAKTVIPRSADKTDITLRGLVNPHNSTLTAVHFEYGPTTAYGSSTPDIAISATGHTEEAVSYALASPLTGRTGVVHYRLVATRDGSPVYGDDEEARLAPGFDLTFDGLDDYINVSDHSALPIYRTGAGTGYSIAMWVKGAPANARVLYGEGTTAGSATFRLMTATTGQLWVYIIDDAGAAVRNAYYTGTLFDNTWHHLAWVDANGSVSYYIDGNLSSNWSYTPGSLTLNRAAAGALLTGSPSSFFSGRLDEVSLWDRALTQAEVRDLMHQPLQGTEANLRAYYNLDEAGDRVLDVVSAGEAPLAGGSAKTSATAPAGVGVEFTATEASGSVTFTGTGLVANYASQAGATVIVSRIDVEPNTTAGIAGTVEILDNQYWVVHRHGTGSFSAALTFQVSEDLTAADQSMPAQIQLYSRDKGSDGSWSLVASAGSVNAATEQATFNGITAANKQLMLIRNLDPLLATNPATLAFRNTKFGCGTQQLSYQLSGAHLAANVEIASPADFQVSTDGANFYSSLSLAPVGGAIGQTIYVRFTPSSAGAYSGSVANSSSGAPTVNVSLTPFEALTVADNATRAMVLTGASPYQYLDVLNFNWNPANVFTVEWWLKPTTSANYNQTIGNGWNGWVFHANTGGVFSCGVANNTNSRIDSASGALLLNTWQHFAYVLNGTNARLYQNGELVGERTNSDGIDFNWGHFRIGYTNSNTINGQLDEFRIWSIARTQQQIKDDMHNVLTGSEPGLRLYLQFNAQSGVAEDYSSYCYTVETYNSPTRQTSTAPAGTVGETVQTNAQASVGDAGKQLRVTITSPAQPSTTSYLGIYRTGDGTSSVSGETFPSGVTRRWSIFWGIREYGSVTADLVIDYSGVPGITDPSAIRLLKRADAASAWADVTAEFTHNTGNRTFSKTGETSFSEFALGDNQPTGIEILDFAATAGVRGVRLAWETASEVDLVGFDLYRAESAEGSPVKLNEEIIPSRQPGSPAGARYEYLDGTAAPGVTYYYWLEVADTNGAITRHGPVAARAAYRLFVPMIMR